MNGLTVGIFTLVTSLFAAQAALGEQSAKAPEDIAHPGAVALSESEPGQWSYKGQPVHHRFHDSVTNPRGDGLDGFHLLTP